MNNIALGIKGEKMAQKFLKKNKYKILETNYKNQLGEVDIIAQKNGFLAFVEVKTRQSTKFGLPREAVDEYKQQKLQMLAISYQREKRLFDMPVAFVVVEVLDDEITLIENAF